MLYKLFEGAKSAIVNHFVLSHLTGIRPEVLESDRAKPETEVGVLLNALVAHGQHLGPAPPVCNQVIPN